MTNFRQIFVFCSILLIAKSADVQVSFAGCSNGFANPTIISASNYSDFRSPGYWNGEHDFQTCAWLVTVTEEDYADNYVPMIFFDVCSISAASSIGIYDGGNDYASTIDYFYGACPNNTDQGYAATGNQLFVTYQTYSVPPSPHTDGFYASAMLQYTASSGGGNKLPIAVYIAFGVAILLTVAVVIMIIVCVCRKKHQMKRQ